MPKTTADLFRNGNANSPRLANVRIGKDIATFEVNGVDWVSAGSGGVSSFSVPGIGKNWWHLDAGYEYADDLVVVNDHGNHFSWEPRQDMPLNDFIRLLKDVETAFHKIS